MEEIDSLLKRKRAKNKKAKTATLSHNLQRQNTFQMKSFSMLTTTFLEILRERSTYVYDRS